MKFVVASARGTTSITGARSTLTPARNTCLPQVPARDCNVLVLHVPWVRAEGIVENHGPLSTWTRPPSWSVEISIGTREVAEVVVRPSSRAVSARTGAAPEVV